RKDLVRLGEQFLDSGLECVRIDHHLQGDVARPTHHLVEQLLREDMTATAQELAPDLLIHLFGVEHQAIEVEYDGAGSRHSVNLLLAGTKPGPEMWGRHSCLV